MDHDQNTMPALKAAWQAAKDNALELKRKLSEQSKNAQPSAESALR